MVSFAFSFFLGHCAEVDGIFVASLGSLGVFFLSPYLRMRSVVRSQDKKGRRNLRNITVGKDAKFVG